ncbi:MAG: TIGR03088 family PEP-CTERM/XrtA system glycosyltransferase [Burkholderiaceae bacterium]
MKHSDTRPLICHVVYRFDVGGLENGVVNLINRLPESAWRHQILALTEVADGFRQRIQRSDVSYVSLAKGPGHLVPLYPALHARFREERPLIVHTRNLAALEGAAPAWSAGVPVRIHGEHGRDARDPDGLRRRYRIVRRAYSPFVSRYVTVSRDLERYLVERVGIASSRVVQLCNGVDTERFRVRRVDDRLPMGCPFDRARHWLVGTVGRMDPVKDQVNLARAFVTALRESPAARERMRLVLAGDGPLRPAVERVIDEAGVRPLVWFAGERSDVPEILRQLDCFVLPSLGEGISNTILEAMACGVPVVATRVGGNSELVSDGYTGSLVDPADSAALARQVLAYFVDPALARRHGAGGRQRVAGSFSLQGMVDRYHELYSKSLHECGLEVPHRLPTAMRSA